MSTVETEPKGSTSSSPDDLAKCTCGHGPNRHELDRCIIEPCACAEFRSKDSLSRGGAEGVHVHEWGTWECIGLDRAEVWIRRCPCGASQSRSEKPEELEAERWKTGRCRDCEEPIPQGVDRCNACAWKARNAEPQYACTVLHKDGDGNTIPCPDEKPQEPVCTHVSHLGPWFQQSDGKWRQVSICELCKVTLPGTHAVHDPCTHCQGPHALEDCKGLEEPEERVCAHVPGGPDECGCPPSCGCCKVEPAPGFDIPRRPPYAVAYAIEGGAQYEVAVSGDATVVAEDGALHILHPKKPVLAIVRIQPMNMEESDG